MSQLSPGRHHPRSFPRADHTPSVRSPSSEYREHSLAVHRHRHHQTSRHEEGKDVTGTAVGAWQ